MSLRIFPFFSLIFIALFIVAAGQANAASCYSMDELEAEQGIKIHSELMVIGLTCQNTSRGGELYAKYRQFTQANSELIAGYERDLIKFFTRIGATAPEKEFHTLRTKLANKISLHAAAMQTNQFCERFAGRLDKAVAMSAQDIRKWASTVWPDHPTSYPLCDSGLKKAELAEMRTSSVN